jgi:uncharacterized protein (DUF433 family)
LFAARYPDAGAAEHGNPTTVVDAAICHGQATFGGIWILVSDVLDDVSRGMTWEAIIERWHGAITKEAIGPGNGGH